MKKRVLTAVFGIPFLIFCLYIRGWFAELVISILALTALIELYRALRAAKYHPFEWGGYIAAIGMWILARLIGRRVMDPLVILCGAMGITIAGVILREKPSFPDLMASLYPLFISLLPMSMFMMLLNRSFGEIQGVALITMSFATAFMGDASAYFGGLAFGKRKLCPELSPHKTVEGAVCYFIGSTIGAILTRLVFIYAFHWDMPHLPGTIAIGLIGGFAGQIGDLNASLLKRYSGIKDYGRIFPGHGGVMDRFDSVIYTVIVLYCYTLVL